MPPIPFIFPIIRYPLERAASSRQPVAHGASSIVVDGALVAAHELRLGPMAAAALVGAVAFVVVLVTYRAQA